MVRIRQIFLFIVVVGILLYNQIIAAQVDCGTINTLYQTVGNVGLGVTEVFRYNNFQQLYTKVGELQGSTNISAINSAYNAVTQYIYSSEGGSSIKVYDPANNFSYVGTINITGNSRNFTNVLFAQGNQVGYVSFDRVILFDVTGIASYPATVVVSDIGIFGSSGTWDYVLMGNYILGVTGSTLRIINLTTNTVTNRAITFNNTLDGLNNQGANFGAAWQDRYGNFYFFSNAGGGIYKIRDVLNTSSTVAEKILLANPSGQNDGFGCELGPDFLDWDNDGISNNIDIDDDNDGILDVDESGGTGLDPGGDFDGDAIYNFRDTDISGFVDVNGDTINDHFDLDLDGIPDAYDLDSDGDGCNDVIEAGFTDDDFDGQLGPSPIIVDGNGLVISGSDGYTIPADVDLNSIFDFLEAGAAPLITTQPLDTTLCPGCTKTISVAASNADTFQWQIYNGSIWVDMTDSGIHSGTTTDTLTITNATTSDHGNQYRINASSTMYICTTETSNAVTLSVTGTTVITNRRITYRVKKN